MAIKIASIMEDNKVMISPVLGESTDRLHDYIMENLIADNIQDESSLVRLYLECVNVGQAQNRDYTADITADDVGFKTIEFQNQKDLGTQLVKELLKHTVYILNTTEEDVEILDADKAVVKVPRLEGAQFISGIFNYKIFEENWESDFITDPNDAEYLFDEAWLPYLQQEWVLTEEEAKEIIEGGLHHSRSIEGTYASIEEFARFWLEEIYMDSDAVSQLMPYIDLIRFGKDTIRETEGYYALESGRVLIYNP